MDEAGPASGFVRPENAEEPEVGLLCPTGRLCWEPYDSMAKVPPCCHCPGSAPARAQGGAWRL